MLIGSKLLLIDALMCEGGPDAMEETFELKKLI